MKIVLPFLVLLSFFMPFADIAEEKWESEKTVWVKKATSLYTTLCNKMRIKDCTANLNPAQQNMQSWTELLPAIEESLRYTKTKPQKSLAVGSVPWEDITYSLKRLASLLPKIDSDISVLLDNFEWIPMYTEANPFLFTGYYHPTLEASRTYKDGYAPLYRMPKDIRKGVAYFDRRAIMNGALSNRNLEIAWAKDPFEAFLLEVQGSGCLVFEDGEKQCIQYAGKNGHKYKSSRRILEDNNLLISANIIEQREFFAQHPEHLALLAENPSYVFFKESQTEEAIGSIGRPLHAWQSIAVDRRYIPLGSIVVLSTTIPDESRHSIPFYAIALAQDTGGAIKKNRIDIFCGATKRAAYVAAKLDSPGYTWMLLAKDRPSLNPIQRN